MSRLNHLLLLLSSLAINILLSFPFSTFSQSTETPSTLTSVLDVDGQELQTDTKYYINPIHSGIGGGLALATKDRACPFYVMQENLQLRNGLPLRFMPVDSNQQVISVSSDVNIVFLAATICVQSTAWRVGEVDEVTGRRYVMSGGVTGHPGVETVSSWFKIEKNEGSGNGYKIVFCPSVWCV